MPGIFEYAGNLYDIDDLKIAVNNNNGTFGTLIDVPAVDMFRMEFQTKNQRANGDGGIAALASAFEAVNVSMRNVGIKREHWAALFPTESYEYNSTPNRVEDFFINFGQPLAYFGAAARIFDGESATSGAIIFVPRIKIMNNVQWQAEYNTFVTPELTGFGIPETNLLTPGGRARSVHVKFYESNLPTIESLGFPIPIGV